MFGRPQLGISLGTLLGIFIWLLGSAAAPALAMDCPVSGFDKIGDRVTEAPSCDAAMQLLMACQMGSSADVAVSLIVIKKCEDDFLASLSAGARRGYERKVGVPLSELRMENVRCLL